MIREYRNKMLSLASILCIIGSVIVFLSMAMAKDFSSSYFWFWTAFLLLGGGVLQASLSRRTRSSISSVFFAVFATIGFAVVLYYDYKVTSFINSPLIFVFPVLVFFLSGCRIGVALNGLMLSFMLGLLIANKGSLELFGGNSRFLVSWIIVVAGSFGVEYGRRVHEKRIVDTSFTDNLTGLINRNGYRARLKLAVLRKTQITLVIMV